MRRRRFVFVALAGTILIGATACVRRDSNSFGVVRDADHAVVDIAGVDGAGPGQLGFDMGMGTLADWYNPCHQQSDANGTYNDAFYSACQDSSVGPVSYFKHFSYTAGGAQVSNRAVEVGNLEWNHCGGQPWCPPQRDNPMATWWAAKVTNWAVELYPTSAGEGGVRLQGNFTRMDGRWALSPALGTIHLPRLGDPYTATLTGSIVGSTPGRVQVDIFQIGTPTMTSSTGYPEFGFWSGLNWATTSYTSGPLPFGHYYVVVNDNATGAAFGKEMDIGPGARVDVNLGAPCLGVWPAYVPHTSQRVC